MDASESLKLFAMTNQLLEHDLDRIEREHAIDLSRGHSSVEADESYYPQIESGVTPRSDDLLDYTNFGDLSEMIKQNFDVFGATFSSVKAVERVMANLNTLRAPIAHCSPLAEDEVVRLRLTVTDWFRLME